MKPIPVVFLLSICWLAPSISYAQQPPSFAKDIRPFFAKYCIECHNPKAIKGGLNLQSYKGLQKGGDKGSVFTPGQPDKSLLVLLSEGKKSPRMPPRKIKRRPTPADLAMLRRWVELGAKDDTNTVKVAVPNIAPKRPVASPVAALAYHPNGRRLAVANYNSVDLIDAQKNKTATPAWITTPAPVTALAYNRQGTRLAVAYGKPGMPAGVRILTVHADSDKLGDTIDIPKAHNDVILHLEFHPNGDTLATCSYDTRVKLWNAADGKLTSTLTEHSDSVYAAAFHPSGNLLATVAADRAVKVWRTDTAQLLYTMSENTDWVYAVAWSPDGKFLAAGGVDKSIRVWRADLDGKQLLHSVFAHLQPVTHLAFSPDGAALYSVSEDRSMKAWDVKRMTESKVYTAQPESMLAFAVRPDHRQLALGRYDGVMVLLDPATGKPTAVIEQKPKPPQANSVVPSAAPRGRTINLTFAGDNLLHVNKITSNAPGIIVTIAKHGQSSLTAAVTLPKNLNPGAYQFLLENAAGKSKPIAFTVDYFPVVVELESNDSPGNGQPITLSATVAGKLNRTGDVDYYRFHVKAGTQIGVQIVPQKQKGKQAFEPFLQLVSAKGKVLAQSSNDILGYTIAADGEYAVGVRDRELQAGAATYRLHVGEMPVVAGVFPLGVQQGKKQEIQIEGVHLGDVKTIRVDAGKSSVGSKLPLALTSPLGTPLGRREIVVGEFPDVFETPAPSGEPIGTIPVPGTANGRLQRPGQSQLWRFAAKKGRTLIVEVNARRLGSQLDSMIEILDTNNQPVPRATLRSLAKTYVTFRDHDSGNANIRIEAWDELAVNDFIWVGNELIKIEALPTHPDSNCVFFSNGGQRTGFLDTTPTFHTVGEPMYKVALHPPGVQFPPNGFPVVTVYYRNDDGGPGYGRDSRLFFTAPADGEYRVRINDSRGQGGVNFGYRLTIRPPRPDFTLSLAPMNPKVFRGGAVPITINAKRIDGFNGKINVQINGLPKGVTAPPTTILPDQASTSIALYADENAKTIKSKGFRVIGQAMIDGGAVEHAAQGNAPTVIAPSDIRTTTKQSVVGIRPGGKTKLTVTVERRNGFKGRIPLEVRGLPHGVRVLDIGLNGILITENETQRTMVFYAEPWVQATDHPIVVLARREGKNTLHAAKSVLLKIVAGK